jgi:uncharacterized protein YqhQ
MKPFKQITIVFVSGIIYLVSSVLIGSESILKNSTQKQEETKSKKKKPSPKSKKEDTTAAKKNKKPRGRTRTYIPPKKDN